MEANDASRIIGVIDNRIARKTGSLASTETTWGEVCGVTDDGKYCSAYLYGDTENPSQDFRVPMDLAVNIGDKVKVAWNERGERWVYDVAIASPYKKVAINPNTGEILQGDGTVPPTPLAFEHDHDAEYSAVGHTHPHDHAGEALKAATLEVTGEVNITDGADGATLKVGDDTEFRDADISHTLQLRSTTDNSMGHLLLGSDSKVVGLPSEVQLVSASGAVARRVRTGGLYVGTNYGEPAPATEGIQFGADVNLYRTASNQLKTDDLFRHRGMGWSRHSMSNTIGNNAFTYVGYGGTNEVTEWGSWSDPWYGVPVTGYYLLQCHMTFTGAGGSRRIAGWWLNNNALLAESEHTYATAGQTFDIHAHSTIVQYLVAGWTVGPVGMQNSGANLVVHTVKVNIAYLGEF